MSPQAAPKPIPNLTLSPNVSARTCCCRCASCSRCSGVSVWLNVWSCRYASRIRLMRRPRMVVRLQRSATRRALSRLEPPTSERTRCPLQRSQRYKFGAGASDDVAAVSVQAGVEAESKIEKKLCIVFNGRVCRASSTRCRFLGTEAKQRCLLLPATWQSGTVQERHSLSRRDRFPQPATSMRSRFHGGMLQNRIESAIRQSGRARLCRFAQNARHELEVI